MDALIIDATHGGVKLAIEFSKLKEYENVYIYDIYNTLKEGEINKLNVRNVKITTLENLKSDNLTIISPVHLPLTSKEIKNKIKADNIKLITHHEGVGKLLNNYFKKHPEIMKIEVTGVKGKTSTVFILKEIFKKFNPLILSSLGIIQIRNNKEITIKKNISITPANIKETVDLAFKIDNPICDISKLKKEVEDNVTYRCLIVESSLGVTGLGDVGLLTNIVENYPIAKNNSDAKTAKSQIFKCKTVAINQKTLDKYYNQEAEELKSKINTFSLENKESNVYVENIEYDIEKTQFTVIYKNIKTTDGKVISGKFNASSFAIGKHHVENILGAITVGLTLNINEKYIIEGLSNYKGIPGRSSIQYKDNIRIIEEINPGINTKAIEYSINMLKNPQNYCIIIGGDYGITCEEINEREVIKLLNNYENLNLIFTGRLGLNLSKYVENNRYIEKYEDAVKYVEKNNLNTLIIYRSDYRKLSKR